MGGHRGNRKTYRSISVELWSLEKYLYLPQVSLDLTIIEPKISKKLSSVAPLPSKIIVKNLELGISLDTIYEAYNTILAEQSKNEIHTYIHYGIRILSIIIMYMYIPRRAMHKQTMPSGQEDEWRSIRTRKIKLSQ